MAIKLFYTYFMKGIAYKFRHIIGHYILWFLRNSEVNTLAFWTGSLTKTLVPFREASISLWPHLLAEHDRYYYMKKNNVSRESLNELGTTSQLSETKQLKKKTFIVKGFHTDILTRLKSMYKIITHKSHSMCIFLCIFNILNTSTCNIHTCTPRMQ